jgi:hypothetical protein
MGTSRVTLQSTLTLSMMTRSITSPIEMTQPIAYVMLSHSLVSLCSVIMLSVKALCYVTLDVPIA